MRPTIIFLLFLCCYSIYAQVDSAAIKQDSIHKAQALKKKIYSGPRRASIMSAVIPGLGQVVNRKYWKAPIIYAALGGLGYAFITTNSSYNEFRNALRYSQSHGDVATVGGLEYSGTALQSMKLYYKKIRDYTAAGIVAVYLLNIIDANVDAHLRTFDVSDDLGIRVSPWLPAYTTQGAVKTGAGLSVKLSLK